MEGTCRSWLNFYKSKRFIYLLFYAPYMCLSILSDVSRLRRASEASCEPWMLGAKSRSWEPNSSPLEGQQVLSVLHSPLLLPFIVSNSGSLSYPCAVWPSNFPCWCAASPAVSAPGLVFAAICYQGEFQQGIIIIRDALGGGGAESSHRSQD